LAWLRRALPYFPRVAEELSNREVRELKARAQLIKPMLKVGKDGLSPAFLKEVDTTLKHHDLVKVKFDEFKEQKKELGPKLAEGVGANLIMQVGHVVVLFRRKPETER
jgi:RNA-binding protein